MSYTVNNVSYSVITVVNYITQAGETFLYYIFLFLLFIFMKNRHSPSRILFFPVFIRLHLAQPFSTKGASSLYSTNPSTFSYLVFVVPLIRLLLPHTLLSSSSILLHPPLHPPTQPKHPHVFSHSLAQPESKGLLVLYPSFEF